MDWIQFWSTVIGHVLSWPVAVVLVVLILKRPLSSLLKRLLTLSGPGDIQATFSEILEKSGIEVSDGPTKNDAPAAIDIKAGEDTPSVTEGDRVEARPSVASGSGTILTPTVDAHNDDRPTAENLRFTLTQLGNWNRHARKRTENLRLNAYNEPEQAIIQAWRFVYEYLELACTVVLDTQKPQNLATMVRVLLDAEILDTRQARDVSTLNQLREVAKRNERQESINVDISGALEYVAIASTLVDQVLTNLEHWTLQAPRPSSPSRLADPPVG